MARKLSPTAESKIMRTNWGYWDGVADRVHSRLAKWYRGVQRNYGHFDACYAEGYNIGAFGGDPPPYAIVAVKQDSTR